MIPVDIGRVCNRCYSVWGGRRGSNNSISVSWCVGDGANGRFCWRCCACSPVMSHLFAICTLASLWWRRIDRRKNEFQRRHGWGDNGD